MHNHVWVAQDTFEILAWTCGYTPACFELEAWHNSSLLCAEVVMLLAATAQQAWRLTPGA